MVSEPGAAKSGVHFVLEGTLEAIALDERGREETLGEHRAPTWIGAIAALTGNPSAVRMQALTDSTLAVVPTERFAELALAQRPVVERVIRQVRPVVDRLTAVERNRERLASLGTMAAGLAHELNNPAAAARRAAADLVESLDVLASTIGHFVESGVERARRPAAGRPAARGHGAPGAARPAGRAGRRRCRRRAAGTAGRSRRARSLAPGRAAGIGGCGRRLAGAGCRPGRRGHASRRFAGWPPR